MTAFRWRSRGSERQKDLATTSSRKLIRSSGRAAPKEPLKTHQPMNSSIFYIIGVIVVVIVIVLKLVGLW